VHRDDVLPLNEMWYEPVSRTSAYVSIRQHTSAYVSRRQQTSAYARFVRACFPEMQALLIPLVIIP
jgi:hypothetical protein